MSRRPKTVTVNDKMQRGYHYVLVAPPGRNFDPEFRPDLRGNRAGAIRLGRASIAQMSEFEQPRNDVYRPVRDGSPHVAFRRFGKLIELGLKGTIAGCRIYEPDEA